MKKISDFVKIIKLNREKDFDAVKNGVGYHVGSAVLCHNGDGMRFITYLEFPAGKVKGNHYHKEKYENMVVIKGEVEAKYYFPNNLDSSYKVTLREGDAVSIRPGVAHAYLSKEGCSVIEFSPQKYNQSDVYKIDKKGDF